MKHGIVSAPDEMRKQSIDTLFTLRSWYEPQTNFIIVIKQRVSCLTLMNACLHRLLIKGPTKTHSVHRQILIKQLT